MSEARTICEGRKKETAKKEKGEAEVQTKQQLLEAEVNNIITSSVI